MIVCYINGRVAIPAAKSDIKVTLQNPFIKDGDEKTMEVIFPMDIPQNAAAFGVLNRLDTSFESEDFEDCRLMADNIEVIHGKGTITSITPSEVKIQILAGKSYLRYKASFENIYIDQIDYGTVAEKYRNLEIGRATSISQLNFVSDLNTNGFIGEPGKYVFYQAHDETNDWWANQLCYMREGDTDNGVTLMNAAVQPNLMMVLDKVFQRLGYKVIRNDFNVAPWSQLYVCSARKSLNIGRALPHWTCYKFLDEFRKLFNAVFLFDELHSQVSVVPFGESGGSGTEYITPAGDFSAGYDEEGLEYLGSSNLEFELSDSERTIDVVSEDVKKGFTIREYAAYNEAFNAFTQMSVKEKMTTLFRIPVGWYYGRSIINDDGDVTGYNLVECGWFSPLIRKEGASTVSLSIVPVGMIWGESHFVTALAGNGKNGAYIIPHKEYAFDCWYQTSNVRTRPRWVPGTPAILTVRLTMSLSRMCSRAVNPFRRLAAMTHPCSCCSPQVSGIRRSPGNCINSTVRATGVSMTRRRSGIQYRSRSAVIRIRCSSPAARCRFSRRLTTATSGTSITRELRSAGTSTATMRSRWISSSMESRILRRSMSSTVGSSSATASNSPLPERVFLR